MKQQLTDTSNKNNKDLDYPYVIMPISKMSEYKKNECYIYNYWDLRNSGVTSMLSEHRSGYELTALV